jgi:REP element-mobilizing transposase RayT
MPYRRRIHVPGGTYHVVQRGSRLHPIFAHSDDYAFFERVLQGALRSSGARLHAYCWTTAAVYLAVQLNGASIGHFMQLLKSRYARGTQQRRGERGYFFQGRYDAVLIEPNAYLLGLIQYIHYVPVLTGLARSPDDYPHTSHHAYREARHVPWLHTQAALQLLDSGEHTVSYQKLMSGPPTSQMVRLFERGAPSSPGILGGPEFREIVGRRAPRSSRMTPDQVTHYVCRLLNVSRDDVQSRSRLRKLALARALIAWHTSVRGVATIAEISRYLGRASSTLSQGVSLYRERFPDLFKRDALDGVARNASSKHAAEADDHPNDGESQRYRSRINGETSK